MTLNEVITELIKIRNVRPALGSKPLHIRSQTSESEKDLWFAYEITGVMLDSTAHDYAHVTLIPECYED